VAKRFQELAQVTPFSVSDITEAGVVLRSFGMDAERFLPVAADLAATFDRQVPDAARALGKALNGSQDGITQLQDSFTIMKRDLQAAGAEVKSTGAILAETTGQQEALANAIEQVAGKFGGVARSQTETP